MSQFDETGRQQATSASDTASTVAAFYRTQFDRAQDLAGAAMDGTERLQRLALQGFRQALSSHLGLLHDLTVRSTRTLVEPRFDLLRDALDRMVELQRDAAQAMAESQRRMFDAASASVQGTGQLFQQAGSIGRDARAGTAPGAAADLMTQAIDQWQSYMGRMLDLAEKQARTAGEQQQKLVMTLEEASGRATDEAQGALRRTETAAGQAMQAGAQAAGQAASGVANAVAGTTGARRGGAAGTAAGTGQRQGETA